MQKSLVIVLALCLISAHAFVKRDAPASTTAGDDTNYVETFQKQFGDLTKQFGDKVKETFDSEQIKKNFNDALSGFQKAIDDLKAKAEATKKE